MAPILKGCQLLCRERDKNKHVVPRCFRSKVAGFGSLRIQVQRYYLDPTYQCHQSPYLRRYLNHYGLQLGSSFATERAGSALSMSQVTANCNPVHSSAAAPQKRRCWRLRQQFPRSDRTDGLALPAHGAQIIADWVWFWS